MRYVGSKNKLSKDLAPIIQSYITDDTTGYLEPFVGGANMIDKIKCPIRIGCDIHKQLIELLKYAQKNNDKLPERILENEYKEVQKNKEIIQIGILVLLDFVQVLELNILVVMQEIQKMIIVENGLLVQLKI